MSFGLGLTQPEHADKLLVAYARFDHACDFGELCELTYPKHGPLIVGTFRSGRVKPYEAIASATSFTTEGGEDFGSDTMDSSAPAASNAAISERNAALSPV